MLDTSFGTGGRVVTAVTSVNPEVNLRTYGDGTLLASGIRYNGTHNVPFVAKFTSAGAPDPSFGTNGVVTLNSLPLGFAVIGSGYDLSGRILIVGTTLDPDPPGPGEYEDIFVARLTISGATDTTFGTNGVAQFALSIVGDRSDRGTTFDVQPDGKIVVGGRTKVTPGLGYDFLLMRLDDTGVRDPSFGTNGVVTTRFPTSTGSNLGRRLWLQPDGKIALVGFVTFGASSACGVARFDSSGVLDTGFGTGGQVLVPMTGCFAVTQQPDGKLVMVGNESLGDVNYATFARLLLTGALDTGFGDGGLLYISNFGSPTRVAAASASGNLVTGLTIQDPADGVQKSYVVELTTTLTGPWVSQTIPLGALPGRTHGETFQLPATASSGLTVSYSASGACTVAGNFVQPNGVGTCTITANQAGNATYFAAPQVLQSFNVVQANQAITFGTAPVDVAVGQPLFMASATSGSGTAPPSTLPIVFSSQTPGICTTSGVNGASLTFLAPGTCTIEASQAGNANYNPASPTTQSFTVGGPLPSPISVDNLNDSGPGSLRARIGEANLNPGPDIVDLTGRSGTILLTSGPIQISGPLTIVGPGAGILTIDGNATNRHFSIGASFPACPTLDGPDYLVAISGVRLTNGHRQVDSSGGSIYTEHSLALDSVVFEGNSATRGGGVAFFVQYPGQTLSITQSQFFDNAAVETVAPAPGSNTASGGGLTVQDKCTGALDVPSVTPATVTIAHSEFRGNVSLPLTLQGRGGAIRSYSLADITISDTVIVDNHVVAPNPPAAGKTYSGGGMNVNAKSLRIERSEISGNSAFDVTGGDVTRSGGLTLSHDAVDRQGPGDAMAVRIINSTISGNASSATAGAILANGNVALEFVNSTMSDNFAAPARTGGIIITTGATNPISGSNAARPTLTVVSSILANSLTGNDIAINNPTVPTFAMYASNSLIEKICPTCAITVSGPLNLIQVGAVLGPDPMLGPLAFNGGTTRTHDLLPGSPAINAGSNPLALATDQRGPGFLRVVGGVADMGAYESGQAVPSSNYAYLSQFGSPGNAIGQFIVPYGVAIDPTSHNIAVTDYSVRRVQIFNSAGTYQSQFGTSGTGDGQFAFPAGIAIDPISRNIVVADSGNNRVQIFSSAGAYLSQFGTGGAGNGQFSQPYAVAIDPTSQKIVVTDGNNRRVQIFSSAGVYLSQFGSLGSGNGQFNTPFGVAIDPTSHNIIVSDFGSNRVQVFDPDGVYVGQFGTVGSGNGQFNGAGGVAIDPTSHNIVVTDYFNNRVQVFSSAGVYLSQFGTPGAGNGQFNGTYGVAIDPASHNAVATDVSNSRVQIFAPQ